MLETKNQLTEQEHFWKGEFGDEYISRNEGLKLLAYKTYYFSSILKNTSKINSCIEFGSNIGLNLDALRTLYPYQEHYGVEINKKACDILQTKIGKENTSNCSILDFHQVKKWDLVLVKGVLIHLNPESLNDVYEKIYNCSNKYILISEYYNPTPVSINYRGHKNKLFKRDFAGEMLDTFDDLELHSYGFGYHRDLNFPQDDENWFLLEKKNDDKLL